MWQAQKICSYGQQCSAEALAGDSKHNKTTIGLQHQKAWA